MPRNQSQAGFLRIVKGDGKRNSRRHECLLSDDRLLDGFDNALFDHHARLRSALERLLGRPFRADGQAEGSFILLSGFEWMRKLGCQILGVL
jgi:hypothetical protein